MRNREGGGGGGSDLSSGRGSRFAGELRIPLSTSLRAYLPTGTDVWGGWGGAGGGGGGSGRLCLSRCHRNVFRRFASAESCLRETLTSLCISMWRARGGGGGGGEGAEIPSREKQAGGGGGGVGEVLCRYRL